MRDEALDGRAFREMKDHYIKNKNFDECIDFLCPQIIYGDKTGSTDNQRHSVEPLLQTLGIFKQELRNHDMCWRPIAYLPELEAKSKAAKAHDNRRNPGDTAQKYHYCLKDVFQAAAELEEEGFVEWMRLGDQVKKVRIYCPTLFIIQDGKAKDMTTLRMNTYKNCGRISAACQTHWEDCDETDHCCDTYLTADEIQEKVRTVLENKEKLQEITNLFKYHLQMEKKRSNRNTPKSPKRKKARSSVAGEEVPQTASQFQKLTSSKKRLCRAMEKTLRKRYSTYNVLNGIVEAGVKFGGSERGIFGATPTDLMHCFQSGLIPYLVKGVVASLTPAKKRELDYLVDSLMGKLRSGEKKDYPKCSFSKQFTNLTLLTSDEWPGMLFTLLIVLSTPPGRAIFQSSFDRSKKAKAAAAAKVQESENRRFARQQSNNDVDVNSIAMDDITGLAATSRDDNVDSDVEGELDEDDVGSFRVEEESVSEDGEETEEEEEEQEDDEEQEESDDEEAHEHEGQGMPDEDNVKKSKEYEVDFDCTCDEFIELLETLLSFHSWYKFGYPYMEYNKDQADKNIRTMLGMLSSRVVRNSGNGWKLQKFHDMLHVAEDIDRFGAAANFDAGPGESMLKIFAKLYAKTAQKRGYWTFLQQVGQRAQEFEAVTRAMMDHGMFPEFEEMFARKKEERRKRLTRIGVLEEADDDSSTGGVTASNDQQDTLPQLGGSYYHVFSSGDLTSWSGALPSSDPNYKEIRAHPAVEKFFWDMTERKKRLEKFRKENRQKLDQDKDKFVVPTEGYCKDVHGKKVWCKFWKCHTECKVSTNDGTILLRCHPNAPCARIGG